MVQIDSKSHMIYEHKSMQLGVIISIPSLTELMITAE